PVRATLLAVAAPDELRIGGLGKHDLRFWPFAAEYARYADHRSAGAIAGHEPVEARASEIVDDLAAGRRLVDVGIGGGLELPGEEPAVLLRQFDRLQVHAETFLYTRGEHHLGAQHAHQPPPFDGEAVGHGDDQR